MREETCRPKAWMRPYGLVDVRLEWVDKTRHRRDEERAPGAPIEHAGDDVRMHAEFSNDRASLPFLA